MERSLDLALLASALGGRTGLPDADELQRLLAQAEVELFLSRAAIGAQLIETAWYLHAVATTNGARELYSLERQTHAFQVSAHIFDLALSQARTPYEQLSLGFGAAIGYRLGGREPNATAIARKVLDAELIAESNLEPGSLALHAGLMLLGFDTRRAFRWFQSQRRSLKLLAQGSGLDSLGPTTLGGVELIVLGAEDLLTYLTRGDARRLERGLERLARAAGQRSSTAQLDTRWVAASLLRFGEEAARGSLWNPLVMPPHVSPLVRQAFTMGAPSVLTLWEPQRNLLTGPRSPFDPTVRRMVLAVPTSGGKSLLAQMLALDELVRANTGVCYVVPTRSLGREVRTAMAARVRILQREVAAELPDFAATSLLDFFKVAPAEVEVMTPERLVHSLRHDPAAVLEKFGIFIFDEAQVMKEASRGFVTEGVITLLNTITEGTHHRIVLISAAMGNAGQVAQWLDGGTRTALRHESDWRGPRRLHAAFTTVADWQNTSVTRSDKAPKYPFRLTTPLDGLLRLRMTSGQTARLSVTQTNWRLVRKSSSPEPNQHGLERDPSSTRIYQIAAEMIGEVTHAGSVLVVAGTRMQARQLASAVAASRPERREVASLVQFVRDQVGGDHPLVGMLEHGAAYHHAGLPSEVLEAIEGAVRDDSLPVLACTSTLTDGVNLPVRTVVLYDQAYDGQSEDQLLRGARLVNAMGRAGRAGRETEGWIVLVRAAQPSSRDFQDLNPAAEDLAVVSSLLEPDTATELADLEGRLRESYDELFAAAEDHGFVDFIWLYLATMEELGFSIADIDPEIIVRNTLAAMQSRDFEVVGRGIAQQVLRHYENTDRTARRRWARTGASLGSARAIDRLAERLSVSIMRAEAQGRQLADLQDPLVLARIIPNTVSSLLQLKEAPVWRFRATPRGEDVEVAPSELLHAWLAGASYVDLAARFLSEVNDPAWRIEQLVDTVTSQFAHYLSWTLGTLIELVNERLDLAGSEAQLCTELGAYVRYGVAKPAALTLLMAGVRSRRLANEVARLLPAEVPTDRASIREWLATGPVGWWRTAFSTTESELVDLLNFTRRPRRSLLRALLDSGETSVSIDALGASTVDADTPLRLEALGPASPIFLVGGADRVATVGAEDHAEVAEILATGLELALSLYEDGGTYSLGLVLERT